jgi:hypothetical protein
MSYSLSPIEDFDSDELSALYNAVADYAQNVSNHIENTPQLKEYFDRLYDDLGEMSTLDEAYLTCGFERLFGVKDSAKQEKEAIELGQYEPLKHKSALMKSSIMIYISKPALARHGTKKQCGWPRLAYISYSPHLYMPQKALSFAVKSARIILRI